MSFAEIRLSWQLDSLHEVTGYVADVCRQAGCSGLRQKQLELALDELFTNSVVHNAKSSDEAASVRLSGGIEGNEIWFQICDPGQAFDPTESSVNTADAPLSDRTVGGLGLHFVRQVIERWIWRYEHDQNCVTLWASIADKVIGPE